MAEPIIYVDRSEVREGRLADLKTAIAGLARLVETREPQILAYDAYLSEDGTEMSVVHVHRDAASLARHMRVVGPELPPFADLVRLRTIDIYGTPGADSLAALREKARLLGAEAVRVHARHAGFARFADPAIAASSAR